MKRLLPVLLALFASLPSLAAYEVHMPVAVQNVLNRYQVSADSVAVYVREIGRTKPLLSINADKPLNPASTIKLLTSWLALEELGPAYKWPTAAWLGGPVVDGVVQGDLIIKGYGDPYFITERLWAFQRGLRKRGIHTIDGDLVIDSSYFVDEYGDSGAFDGEGLRSYNVMPNAFLVNFHAMHMLYQPDPQANKVGLIIDPLPSNLTVDNRLKLVNGRCGGYQNGISVTATDDARDRIVITGNFGRDCEEYSMTRSALSAPAFAYGVFRSLWEESGGVLNGGWREGSAPADAEPFLDTLSPPLDDVIEYVNKYSNNVMARHLLLTLGAEAFDPPGSLAKGRRAAYEALNRRGMSIEGLRIDNGAGLSRNTRIAAASLGDSLVRAAQTAWAPEFISSLSLSGLDGTMRKRFVDEELTGQMHLKTGRLQNVFATAGYVRARSGSDYVVVILQNFQGADDGPGEAAQIALLRWVYEK